MKLNIITTAELQLGDQVRMTYQNDFTPDGDVDLNPLHLESSPFFVRMTNEKETRLWRPYIAHADFSCGNSVIPYVGIEEMTVYACDSLQWILIRRVKLA